MDTIRTAISVLRTLQTGRSLYRGATHALGLDHDSYAGGGSSTVARMAWAAGLVGGGVLVGATLGMLFAPMSGKELREKVSDQVGELLGHLVFGDEAGEEADEGEAGPTGTEPT